MTVRVSARFVALPLLALLAATPAVAGALEPGKFAVSLRASGDFPVGGEVHSGVTTGAIPINTLTPLLTPVPTLPVGTTSARLAIDSRSFDDLYKTGIGFGGELAYGLGRGIELIGAVGYSRMNGGQAQVGTATLLNAAGTQVGTTAPVFGRFGDYTAWTVEAGARAFFLEGPIQPYVAARAGARFVDSISADFTIPALNLTTKLNDTPFYRSSTVFTAGLDVGIDWTLAPGASFGVETGLRYAGKLRGDDSRLAGLGLASINNGGNLLSVPITVVARIGF